VVRKKYTKCTNVLALVFLVHKIYKKHRFLIIRMIGLQQPQSPWGVGEATPEPIGEREIIHMPPLPMGSGAVLQSYHSNNKNLTFSCFFVDLCKQNTSASGIIWNFTDHN
jgi:hypothetical protein